MTSSKNAVMRDSTLHRVAMSGWTYAGVDALCLVVAIGLGVAVNDRHSGECGAVLTTPGWILAGTWVALVVVAISTLLGIAFPVWKASRGEAGPVEALLAPLVLVVVGLPAVAALILVLRLAVPFHVTCEGLAELTALLGPAASI
ncbi:hypothetical protein J4573_09295 [Actinomadura barringtoniae]|uniref:Uncharacterized protein n=1 Tax=Actinomadura barringtoniae TaxID=1427535 RepID=A0A939T2X7_9ACTN|nr:hypothetical protein [Actinomadura barringtoniae]MBO2447278.1 hypothetical protein [Actinomadura barringtoniae]